MGICRLKLKKPVIAAIAGALSPLSDCIGQVMLWPAVLSWLPGAIFEWPRRTRCWGCSVDVGVSH